MLTSGRLGPKKTNQGHHEKASKHVWVNEPVNINIKKMTMKIYFSFTKQLIIFTGLHFSTLSLVNKLSNLRIKQLTIVVWLSWFHADRSNCKAVNNDTFGSGLLESRLRSISLRIVSCNRPCDILLRLDLSADSLM